jgi:CheY-like chemotaxis protein
MEKLGWSVVASPLESGEQSLTVHIASMDSTLLVIDDNEGIADLIKRFLAGSDVRVVPAMTGMEGVQLASEIEPDAILLDVMMPHMDGWEVLQILRSRPATSHIPVIICSVFNDSELARSLGASASISKPIKREDVIAALKKSGLLLITG